MIKVTSSGSFRNFEQFSRRVKSEAFLAVLVKYGNTGVAALRRATPLRKDRTAESWGYEIVRRPGYFSIKWVNTYREHPENAPVAALIQFGHGTRGGAYFSGTDYINPTMRPIFQQMAADMWKEVTK